MSRLFFLLSGEHPSLPFSELKSILTAEGHEYRELERLTQVLLVEANVRSSKAVASRSAMTRVCGLELFSCAAEFEEILEKMQSTFLDAFLKPRESFAVRIRRIQRAAPRLTRIELERKLGELIRGRVKGAKVNLDSPDKTFFGILSDDCFVFGLKTAETPTKPFFDRNPQKRPFFHPTAMPPKLARCMVNFAQPKRGDLVLDPFCGTASMLVEAGLIGCRVLGLDAQLNMVKGSLQNLMHFGVEPEGLVVADARQVPVGEIGCVVTDPPYGRSATTLGEKTGQIIESFLSSVDEFLPKERRVCMAAPKSVELGEMGKSLGLKHEESHLVYVHRSLTREIAIFERV